MFIHKTYQLCEPNQPIAEYKKKVSTLCKINLRRSNKFNLLAVYGALSCANEIPLLQSTGIYLAMEYGPTQSLQNVLDQVNKSHGVVMPFDFLGINTNASFYVAQALGATGKHMILTSHHLSLEKSLQLAYFDLAHHEVDDVIVGAVDASIEFIENYQDYMTCQNKESLDKSYWLYANRNPENALAKIEAIEEFSSREAFNEKYEGKVISHSFHDTLNQPNLEGENILHVAHDENGKYIVMEITKTSF